MAHCHGASAPIGEQRQAWYNGGFLILLFGLHD